MGVTIVVLLILAVVVGGGLWTVKVLKPKGDEDVITVEPEPTPYQKTGVGKALAMIKPDRIESEVKMDAVVVRPKHQIVGTSTKWDASVGYQSFRWECSCGASGSKYFQSLALSAASDHTRDENRAEELKAKSNGRFSW